MVSPDQQRHQEQERYGVATSADTRGRTMDWTRHRDHVGCVADDALSVILPMRMLPSRTRVDSEGGHGP
jgi:hypothetical protein